MKRTRRDALKAEARRLFRANGYDGTTIDEIAEAAGMTARGFYVYYATKDELYRALVAEDLDGNTESVITQPLAHRL